MGLVLVASIGLRVVALAWSLLLLVRFRDWRLLFLVAMLALMTARQGLTLSSHQDAAHQASGWSHLWPESFGLAVSAMSAGAVAALHGSLRRRQRREEELLAREGRYRLLVEGVRLIAWEFNQADKRFTFVSRGAAEILGYPLEAWQRPTFWYDHLHPDDRERARAYCQQQIGLDRDYELEYRMLSAGGGTVWFRDFTTLVRDGKGAVVGLRGVFIDISERRLAEDALRHSEELRRSITDNCPDIISLVDREGTVLFTNRTLADYTVGGVLGTSIYSYVRPARRQEVRAASP
jgi:PAS domain S-box-containing protein